MTNKRVSSIAFHAKPPPKKKRKFLIGSFPYHRLNLFSRNARRNWNEERRVNAETFGLKYRPIQQGGNQRNQQQQQQQQQLSTK